MTEALIEVLVIFVLTLVNGVFAMAETAIVSARKTRLQHAANSGDAAARIALDLANAPNLFLSTIQVGITLIGILAGVFGGATIANRLALLVNAIPTLTPYSQAVSFTIVVLVITFFSLIVGELVPKRLALQNPERIAALIAPAMQRLSRLASPIVRWLSGATDAVLRLFGVQASPATPVSAEEIKLMMQQSTQAGIFQPAEQDLIAHVFRLGDRRLSALMTPRPNIVWLNLDEPLSVIQQKITHQHHSYYLVCRGSFDNLLGVVHVKDILAQSLNDKTIALEKILRQPLFVPETMGALKALEQFKQAGVHVALVVDEYGVVQGLVTLIDLLASIVGDIPADDAPVKPDIVRRADGSWLVDGALPIDEVKELLAVDKLPGENQFGYQTLGGLMMSQIGRVPAPADFFVWQTWRFEVVDMDGRRVDKVLIANHAAASTERR